MGSACSEANAKGEEKQRCVVVGPSSVKKWTAHNKNAISQFNSHNLKSAANLILDLISMCILAQSGGTCTENK